MLIGAHVFDGLLATAVGEAVTAGVVPGPVMLLACMAAVYGLVTGAVRGREYLAAAFVPDVAGHAIAHYAGPVLVDLQVLAIRALLVVGAIAGVALQFGTGGHG